jgi:hypothetical protein
MLHSWGFLVVNTVNAAPSHHLADRWPTDSRWLHVTSVESPSLGVVWEVTNISVTATVIRCNLKCTQLGPVIRQNRIEFACAFSAWLWL